MASNFQYSALDKSGKKVRGELTANSRVEASRALLGKSLQPISLSETAKPAKSKSVTPANEKIILNARSVIEFTEEISELLAAGLPLEPALSSMEQRDEGGKIKEVCLRLRQKVTEGIPLYQALPTVSDQFDTLYCNLVRAGEASGSLQSILSQHAIYLKEQMDLKAKLTQAFIYPAFLTLACVGVSLIFIFYLLPKITGLLERMSDSEMPVGVTIAVAVGDLLRNYWGQILVFVGLVIVAVNFWLSFEKNKYRWDHWKMHIPLYGKVVTYGFYVHWLQTLANLVDNGVALVKALELTQETVTNRYVKEKLIDMLEKVKDGYKLTKSMRSTQLFTLNMVDLVGVGENTGKLSNALKRASHYYNEKLSSMLSKLLGIISPAILLSMALLVALLSWTMVQAIYQTISNLKN